MEEEKGIKKLRRENNKIVEEEENKKEWGGKIIKLWRSGGK